MQGRSERSLARSDPIGGNTGELKLTTETKPSDALKILKEDEEGQRFMEEFFSDEGNKLALQQMGLLTALSITIHNLPEGLATFVAALNDPLNGVPIALGIALHNIPEGVCVAIPIYYATGSRWKGFLYALASGFSELIGGLLGYAVLYGDRMSDVAYGVLFCLVAGMMVCLLRVLVLFNTR